MNDIDVEKRIREEFESVTPNNLDAILKDCETADGSAKILELPTKRSREKIIRRCAGLAAAFVIAFAIGIASFVSISNNADGSVIALDVNPGIEITLNRQDKVKTMRATNDEGLEILQELDVTGEKIDSALTAIVDSLVAGGYLNENANSVLVSVSSAENDDASQLQSLLTEKITSLLSTKGVEASVLTQVVTQNDELSALAEEYKMSEGKARLIDELVKKDGRHTFEELSSLTVNELSLLLNDTKLMPTDVKAHGSASKKTYISETDALNIALKAAGFTASEVTGADAELDYMKKHGDNRGAMTYKVKFFRDGRVYKFDVDAQTGKILKERIEEGRNEAPPSGGRPESRPEDMIGKENAIEAAKEAGFDPKRVDDFDTEVERDRNGNWYYEIEFSKDGKEERIRVDAKNGEIIKQFQ